MGMMESRKSNRPDIRKSIRQAEYYGMTPVFDELYADSLKGKVFTNLMQTIQKRENILLAYKGRPISNTTDYVLSRWKQQC